MRNTLKTLAEEIIDASSPSSDLRLLKSKESQRKAESQYAKALERISDLQGQVDLLTDVPKTVTRDFARNYDSATGEVAAVLVLGDWHCEEEVDPATCNGRNEYNAKNRQARVDRVFHEALCQIEQRRQRSKIDELLVVVVGDLVSGFIHDESEILNSLGPTEAVILARDLLVSGIDFLASQAGVKLIRVACCMGNHGRTTEKSRPATEYKTNLEWLMYRIVQRDMAIRKRPIEVLVADGYHLIVDVKGHKMRCHHGTRINYRGGRAGIHAPARNAIDDWNKETRVTTDLFGHWHTHVIGCGNRYVGCGSVMGYSAYSVWLRAEYEPPSQAILYVGRSRGPFSPDQLLCE